MLNEIKVEDLSKSEALLLQRLRLKETQPKAAKRHNVTYKTYCSWERGRDEFCPDVREQIKEIKIYENCFLLRKRKRLSLRNLAQKTGVCKFWINKIEKGRAPHSRLVDFWEKQYGKS